MQGRIGMWSRPVRARWSQGYRQPPLWLVHTKRQLPGPDVAHVLELQVVDFVHRWSICINGCHDQYKPWLCNMRFWNVLYRHQQRELQRLAYLWTRSIRTRQWHHVLRPYLRSVLPWSHIPGPAESYLYFV